MGAILSREIGDLALARGTIGRATRLEDFQRIAPSTTLREEPIGEHRYMLIARFVQDTLVQLTLMNEEPAVGSWDDYTTEKELQRLAAHEAFLERELGVPHESDRKHYFLKWTFSWGEAHSSFSPRDGICTIHIFYRAPHQ